MRHLFTICCIALTGGLAFVPARAVDAQNVRLAAASTRPASPVVGEQVPSEDPSIKDFHSLGVVNGQLRLFRSASLSRDLFREAQANEAAARLEVRARMERLVKLGVRTIVSLEAPDPATAKKSDTPAEREARIRWCNTEKAEAAAAGIKYISHPIANAGAESLEDLSDAQVVNILDSTLEVIFKAADDGGVVFHCSAGHDRTGITAAYIRLKIQKWPVDQAIAEMRRLGHNWPKFSKNDGQTSWHEDHLRAIDRLLREQQAQGAAISRE
ncbi:MAG: tyrosine-protein phosphatase [Tepidisphaeraceae bacterium]|jgi:hypothetical protein